jgi:hypothetical protein
MEHLGFWILDLRFWIELLGHAHMAGNPESKIKIQYAAGAAATTRSRPRPELQHIGSW